jgi:hypothetical protein
MALQRVAGGCEAMGTAVKSPPSSWVQAQDIGFRRGQASLGRKGAGFAR